MWPAGAQVTKFQQTRITAMERTRNIPRPLDQSQSQLLLPVRWRTMLRNESCRRPCSWNMPKTVMTQTLHRTTTIRRGTMTNTLRTLPFAQRPPTSVSQNGLVCRNSERCPHPLLQIINPPSLLFVQHLSLLPRAPTPSHSLTLPHLRSLFHLHRNVQLLRHVVLSPHTMVRPRRPWPTTL